MTAFTKALKELTENELVNFQFVCTLYKDYFGTASYESIDSLQRGLYMLAIACAKQDIDLLKDFRNVLRQSLDQLQAVVMNKYIQLRERFDCHYHSCYRLRIFKFRRPLISIKKWEELIAVSDLIFKADLDLDYEKRFSNYTDAYKRLDKLDKQVPLPPFL